MEIFSAPHAEEHQHDHHRNGDEAAAAATVSPATAAIVVTATTTAAGRAAKVAIEGRHVLGIARVAFAKVAVITVCRCVFLRLKCVLLFLRSFYRKIYPINLSFSFSCHLILP